MAQSRNRRQQRVKGRSNQPVIERMPRNAATVRTRRIVIAFLLLLGLAGVLALSPSTDGDGAPPAPISGL